MQQKKNNVSDFCKVVTALGKEAVEGNQKGINLIFERLSKAGYKLKTDADPRVVSDLIVFLNEEVSNEY